MIDAFGKIRKKYYRCDSCRKEVWYKGQAIPFQGNFLHQGPETPQSLSDKEEQWSIGMWDATWLCVDCLCVHHDCPKDFARKHLIGNFSFQRGKAKATYYQSRKLMEPMVKSRQLLRQ